MRKIIVPKQYDNKMLVNFILDSFKSLNQNQLYKALRKKDVRVNNIKVQENQAIHEGDEITIYIVDEILLGKKDINLEVVYEDDNILAINKPSGISVTENDLNETSLTKLVKDSFGNNVEPCHRLDRNTSGIVLFAKDKESLDIMLQKFKNEEIEKHYYTKVYGIVKEDHKVLKDYLFKDAKLNMVYVSKEKKKNYQEIVTEYNVLERNKEENTTSLDVTLHTGRTHQIRAHLSFIGYPIIGDGKYGSNEINKKFGLKSQYLISYKLIFRFKTDSRKLNYLNGKEISIKI